MIPAQQDIASASPIPDEIWVAKYDNKATIWNLGTLTDTPWPSNQRMHQYLNYNNDSSPAGESYGGTTFDCPNSCIDRDIDDAPVAGGAGMKTYSSWTINYIDYPSSPPDSQLWAANDANMGEPDGAGAYVPPLVTGGYCITPCYSASSDQGFWWSGGTFYDTNPYFGNMTQPRGVNDAGLITGAYLNGAATLGFSLDTTTGTASSVTLPSSWGAEQTVPNGINDAGEISGFYYTSTGPYGFIKDDQGNWTKIVHSKASGTWLGQINGFGEVAGYYQDNKGNDYGFVYSEATGFTPINCPSGSTQISGINNNDQVVGNCGDGMYGSMFIYDMAHGTFTTIISPAQAGYVEPSGINDQNVVVGRCQASPCVSGNGYEDGFYEVPNP